MMDDFVFVPIQICQPASRVKGRQTVREDNHLEVQHFVQFLSIDL